MKERQLLLPGKEFKKTSSSTRQKDFFHYAEDIREAFFKSIKVIEITPVEQNEYRASKLQLPMVISRDGNNFLSPRRDVDPNYFAPSTTGQQALMIMLYAESCERILDFETKEKCPNEPKFVLDFDVLGDLDQLAVCGEECMRSIRERVDTDLKAAGRSKTIYGINGK